MDRSQVNESRMQTFIIFLLCSTTLGLGTLAQGTEDLSAISTQLSESNAEGRGIKWFPFLAVVSFPSTRCMGNGNSGVCYTKKQCTEKGGTDSGSSCAQGYGTCCLFTVSCTGFPGSVTVTNNMTHVTGSFLNGTQQPCTIKIPKQPGVCQVRVDFTTFNVGTALPDGTCPTDTMTFTGAANLQPNGLTICGQAVNQHLYLHYGDAETLTINANLISPGSMYDLQITMIKCDSRLKAPTGCTQYYPAPRGTVTSFNFPKQQLNSERYTVCVDSPGSSISWAQCNDANSMFFITGQPVTPPGSLMGAESCPTDYVMIPPNNIRCGLNFTEITSSTAKPFVLYVNFDDQEDPIVPAMNPDTGCPLGFECIKDPPDPMAKCVDGDTCQPPLFFADLADFGNTGFCLTYSVS